MGELATIAELDGRTIGTGEMGAMTERISTLFRKLTETEGTQVVEIA